MQVGQEGRWGKWFRRVAIMCLSPNYEPERGIYMMAFSLALPDLQVTLAVSALPLHPHLQFNFKLSGKNRSPDVCLPVKL